LNPRHADYDSVVHFVIYNNKHIYQICETMCETSAFHFILK